MEDLVPFQPKILHFLSAWIRLNLKCMDLLAWIWSSFPLFFHENSKSLSRWISGDVPCRFMSSLGCHVPSVFLWIIIPHLHDNVFKWPNWSKAISILIPPHIMALMLIWLFLVSFPLTRSVSSLPPSLPTALGICGETRFTEHLRRFHTMQIQLSGVPVLAHRPYLWPPFSERSTSIGNVID